MTVLVLLILLLSEKHDVPSFQGDYKVRLSPLDFSDEDNAKTLFSGLGQLESDGQRLYVADQKTPHVLVIDRTGRFVRAIGRAGSGPEGLGRGVFSFAQEDGHLWLTDWQRQALHFYQGDEHIARFPLPRTWMLSGAANPFAISLEKGVLVFQAPPETGAMGSVYDFHGTLLRHIGPLPEFDPETVLAHPWIHSTLWVRGNQHWYALFTSIPTIVVFDDALEEVDRFHLKGPEITYTEERFEHHLQTHPNKRGSRSFKTPPLHFTDFKWYDGHLYTLSRGTLYQIDPTTGKTRSRTRFTTPEGETVFFYVTFMDHRTIVLGHPVMVRDHDLWIAENVPFLQP